MNKVEAKLIEMRKNNQTPDFCFVNKNLLEGGNFFLTNDCFGDAVVCQTTSIEWSEDSGETFEEIHLNVYFDMIDDACELDDQRIYIESNNFTVEWV